MKRPNLKKRIRKTDFDTQRDFAYSVNINYRKISEFISGVRNPTNEELEKIAQGLDCEIGDVMNDWGE